MEKIDYSKIFIKEACPTSIGGQAVMEGIMMQGPDRVALAMRLPSGEIFLRTKRQEKKSKLLSIPLVRGVVAFVKSLVQGTSTLMESADVLEQYAPEQYSEEPGKFETWISNKYGKKAAWNFMLGASVVIAIALSLAIFVILPTWIVSFLGKWISNAIVLNLIEGIFRIILFICYVLAVRNVEEINTLFRYHGAEHKTIHAFENGVELTPENAQKFYTLHPRCGTSFLVFVLIISLLLFSLFGWPNLLLRIVSRLVLIPVIAGLSYELLKWAGRSSSPIVKALSWPGLMLQRLTTAEPSQDQLEVAIVALKAVLAKETDADINGIVDSNGNLLKVDVEELRSSNVESFLSSLDGSMNDNKAIDGALFKSEDAGDLPITNNQIKLFDSDEPVNNIDSSLFLQIDRMKEGGITFSDMRLNTIYPSEEEGLYVGGENNMSGQDAETQGTFQEIIRGGKDLVEGGKRIANKLVGGDWEAKKKQINEIKNGILEKLGWEIAEKDESVEGFRASNDDLWHEDSLVMSKKLPAENDGPATEEDILQAISFLNELDKDGYTIVAPEEFDGVTIAKAIADKFAEDAKARTLARRYTNDISTIDNALRWGQASLSMVPNGRNEALMILSYATGLPRTELITRGRELMNSEDFAIYDKKIQERLMGKPLQYLVGMTEFMGLPFKVNPSVLIPRLDTEIVAEHAINIAKSYEGDSYILDLCTGSGALGICIAAKVSQAYVTLSDISEDAIKTARENALINNVGRKCTFCCGDMFDALSHSKRFDMIVSNPPYIETGEIDKLDIEVKKYEPRHALDGGADGLNFYRIIAREASMHLRSGGSLVLEIGSKQGDAVSTMLGNEKTYSNIRIIKDLAGLDRCIVAERQ